MRGMSGFREVFGRMEDFKSSHENIPITSLIWR